MSTTTNKTQKDSGNEEEKMIGITIEEIDWVKVEKDKNKKSTNVTQITKK